MASTGHEDDELQALKIENARLKNTNEENLVFKQKYIDVIGKLNNLSDAPNTTSTANNEDLLNNADDVVTKVVSSFSSLSQKNQAQVHEIGEEGASFLKRLETLERKNVQTAADVSYAVGEIEDIKQYLKLEALLVHGLKDFPLLIKRVTSKRAEHSVIIWLVSLKSYYLS